MTGYQIKTLRLADWEKEITGLWLAENDGWLLLRHIAVDYVVDGYQLVAKRFIVEVQQDKSTAQVGRVLRLKGVSNLAPESFVLGSVVEMLQRKKILASADSCATTIQGTIR